MEVQADGTVARAAGDEMPGSYINFYMPNGGIILPQFGDQERDANALEIFQQQFPNRIVVPVQSRDLLCGGGNIHCITQQQPSGCKDQSRWGVVFIRRESVCLLEKGSSVKVKRGCKNEM